jgi:FkbM family methyltransferase
MPAPCNCRTMTAALSPRSASRTFRMNRADPAARETIVVDSIFGPITAFEGDFATGQIAQFGAHSRNELALLRTFVDPGDLVYDVGAHIGTFAIPLAQACGESGRVIAIEADASNFALLRHNLGQHGLLGRVTPLCGLAGAGTGRFRAVRFPGHTSATYFTPDPAGESLATIRIDDLHAMDPARVGVIKIDVEGMELCVLQSAERTIARDRPLLHVEMSPEQLSRQGATPDDIEALMRRHDYRFFRNVGERNSAHDRFELIEITSLGEAGAFYDVLAVAAGDAKLARAMQAARSRTDVSSP